MMKTIYKLSLILCYLGLTFSTELKCIFDFDENLNYNCYVKELELDVNERILEISGEHIQERNNNDVFMVHISSQHVKRIPNEVFLEFPYLQNFEFYCLMAGENCMNNSLFERVFFGANNLKTIIIVGSTITELPANVFRGAEGIDQLYVVNCNVNEVANTSFQGLHNLEVLDLSSNSISSFSWGTFDDLTSLMVLRLAGNVLENVNTNIFERNLKLKELGLQNNRIKVLAPWFDRKFDLELVDLSKNVCIDDALEGFEINKIVESCSPVGDLDELERINSALSEEVRTLLVRTSKFDV